MRSTTTLWLGILFLFFSKGVVSYLSDGAHFWIIDLTFFVLLPILLLFYSAEIRSQVANFKNDQLNWFEVVLVTFFIFVFFTLITIISFYHARQLIPDWLSYTPIISYSEKLNSMDRVSRWIAIIYLSFSAAFAEELIFRILPHIIFNPRTFWSRIAFTFGTAILFALGHWAIGGVVMLATIIPGIIFAIACLRFRDWRVLFFLHASADMVLLNG
jgi:membrane protease YdiL (CAAX protease family)